MRHTFERYKSVAEEALKMFCRYDMNTRADISTVLKILMLYPYQISDGSYIYKFENYKTFEELPDEAKSDLMGSMFWHDPNCFDEENKEQ